ncbi:hypothetical protein IAD21_05924 [Abditibacteriota bacterium]|nr:hypothetical protein IAD21_05924 [Abditibacteriota bacterium]
MRLITPVLCLCIGIWFIFFLFSAPPLVQLAIVGPYVAFSICSVRGQLETLFYPLIRVDEDGVQVKRRKLLWSDIESLQIENDVRGVASTKWQVFDLAGRRIANVDLGDNSLLQQKMIVAAIAQVLNAQLEEYPLYNPPKRIEGHSYNPVERPY